jgi:hypothetical protein
VPADPFALHKKYAHPITHGSLALAAFVTLGTWLLDIETRGRERDLGGPELYCERPGLIHSSVLYTNPKRKRGELLGALLAPLCAG